MPEFLKQKNIGALTLLAVISPLIANCYVAYTPTYSLETTPYNYPVYGPYVSPYDTLSVATYSPITYYTTAPYAYPGSSSYRFVQEDKPDVVDSSDSPKTSDFTVPDKQKDDKEHKKFELPQHEAFTLYGVTIKDGIAKVHKITITKEAEGKVKVTTPNGVFFTTNFALTEGDNKSEINSVDGPPTRLLYIHQNGHTGTFFYTEDGRIGFMDAKVIHAESVEEANEKAQGFLSHVGDNLNRLFTKAFKKDQKLESDVNRPGRPAGPSADVGRPTRPTRPSDGVNRPARPAFPSDGINRPARPLPGRPEVSPPHYEDGYPEYEDAVSIPGNLDVDDEFDDEHEPEHNGHDHDNHQPEFEAPKYPNELARYGGRRGRY